MESVADARGGAGAAQAQAIDGGDADALARGLLSVGDDRFDAARLAGFGPADLHFGARAGARAESVVEADHTRHIGAAEVEALRDQLLAVGIDAADFGLHLMPDRK